MVTHKVGLTKEEGRGQDSVWDSWEREYKWKLKKGGEKMQRCLRRFWQGKTQN